MFDFFVGLWPVIWKSIGAVGVASMFMVLAFVPSSWVPMWVRKVALWGGALTLMFTFAYAVGVRDEHKHGVAQWNLKIDQEIEGGGKDRTEGDAAVVRSADDDELLAHDRYNRDSRTGRQ